MLSSLLSLDLAFNELEDLDATLQVCALGVKIIPGLRFAFQMWASPGHHRAQSPCCMRDREHSHCGPPDPMTGLVPP